MPALTRHRPETGPGPTAEALEHAAKMALLEAHLATPEAVAFREAGGWIRKADLPNPELSLIRFCERTTGFQLEKWQRRICKRLERLKTERGQRVLLHAPPQFGKSILASQRFPAWIIGHRPEVRVRLAAYNQTHAQRFSKVLLSLMREPTFERDFPKCHLPPVCSVDEWSTLERSAFQDGQSSFAALGIGSGFVGLGADLLILDDVYKSRADAFSEVIGENIWLWWQQVVYSRLNPDTNVLVFFHRWKQDDLVGRLLEQGGWEYLRFPAIADGEDGDSSRLPVGEPLSARYSIPWLKGVEKGQGTWAFYSLFQGRPQPPEGALFREEWFHSFHEDGEYYVLKDGRRVPVDTCWRFASADLAVSERTQADWTVIGVWAVTRQKDLLLLDVLRLQTGSPANRIDAFCRPYSPAFLAVERNGVGVQVCRDLAEKGYAVRGVWQSTDKISRAMTASARYQAGKVHHRDGGDWELGLRSELMSFPGAEHDDQVDMCSIAAAQVAQSYGVYDDFSAAMHVAINELEYDEAAPLMVGWAVDPRPAMVVSQMDAARCLNVYGGLVARLGESPVGFIERTQELMSRAFGDSLTRVQDYGDPLWFETDKAGSAAGAVLVRALRQTTRRGMRQGEGSVERRVEAVQKLLRTLIQGNPAVLVASDAVMVIDALAGGARYAVSTITGMPTDKLEQNSSLAVSDALGHVVSRMKSVRTSEEDIYPTYQRPPRNLGQRVRR